MPKKSKSNRHKIAMNYIDNYDKTAATDKEWDNRPELHGVMQKEDYKFIQDMNDVTMKSLGSEWGDNIKANAKYFRKHKSLRSIANLQLAKNKAVIGIGAGPSFNKNKDILQQYLLVDGVQDWEHRNFVTICANHQYKPLLEMDIIPDFVIQVDASDVTMDQLTKDIPPSGQNTTLITGMHTSPRVIEEWSKQKRDILFYGPSPDGLKSVFKKATGKNPNFHSIEMGGCTVNGAFMAGVTVLGSSVFIAVGHDCSFEIKPDMDDQRRLYYADENYTSNAKVTGTGRDEANNSKRWGGFTLSRRKVIEPNKPLSRYNIELDEIGTSHTLWVYKTWVDVTLMGLAQNKLSLHYYNCTEGGIVGVMAKDRDRKSMEDPKNWYMLDKSAQNVHSNAYMFHTALLSDVLPYFNKLREMFLNGTIPSEMSRMQQIWEPQTGRLVQVVPH